MVVWRLEGRLALRRRRVFALNLLVPLALVAAVAVGGAPAPHAAAVYAVLFTFFGVFGSAIPFVRDAERGLLGRVVLTGISLPRLAVGRTLAGAAVDLLQLLPSLLLLGVLAGAGATSLAWLCALTLLTLLWANALGIWVASLARSIAEAALFGAVASLLLLHGAGVFRTPLPGSAAAGVEGLLPPSHLHQALLETIGRGAVALPPQALLAALLGSLAALAVTAAAAPALVRRLGLPAVR